MGIDMSWGIRETSKSALIETMDPVSIYLKSDVVAGTLQSDYCSY